MGFGANVALGWFMMLVAMTFSTELFICATAGLILGHFIFAAPDSKEILGSPCCNAVNGANDKKKAATVAAASFAGWGGRCEFCNRRHDMLIMHGHCVRRASRRDGSHRCLRELSCQPGGGALHASSYSGAAH